MTMASKANNSKKHRMARLTILYEEADYTKKKLDDDHRINAVSALRTVVESLDSNDSLLEE